MSRPSWDVERDSMTTEQLEVLSAIEFEQASRVRAENPQTEAELRVICNDVLESYKRRGIIPIRS